MRIAQGRASPQLLPSAHGDSSSSSAGSGHSQSIPATAPPFNALWRSGFEHVCVKVTVGRCHRHRGTCNPRETRVDTRCLHSTTQLSLLLRKGSWHKLPPSGAFSDPSSMSRMKTHVEQAILNSFLAKKKKKIYYVLDISPVVGTRSPGPKVTHRAGSPWQHIQ